jgi:hypothetical protein
MIITIDPTATTSFGELSHLTSDGLIQGDVQVNPFTSAGLEAGVVASNATYPLYAGLPISLGVQILGSDRKGVTVRKSFVGNVAAGIQGWTTSQGSGVMGFSSFTSQPPLFPQGGSINFYKSGSKGRVAVRINNTLAAALANTDFITTPVMWDWTNDELVAWTSGTDAANLQLTTVSIIAVSPYNANHNLSIAYDTGTGVATYATNKSLAIIEV